MLKPDKYMPFHWLSFWQAVEGDSDVCVVAYLRALTNYWYGENCGGLPDDDERLRKICRVERGDWPAVQARIFNRAGESFFNLSEDGKWHQERCRAEFLKSVDALARCSEAGRKGARSRWPGQ